MNSKKIIKKIFLAAVLLVFSLGALAFVLPKETILAQSCPLNTQAGDTFATLVGEITDDGGDPNLEVWFQYGLTPSYGSETPRQSKFGLGLFCATITGLTPNTTYHYRAVARNAAGTNNGESRAFTTRPLTQPAADIKANNSDGPVSVSFRSNITLSWNSANADFCFAEGDWEGHKNTSDFETFQLNTVKTYIFTIKCKNSNSGQTAVDSARVTVNPNLPTVVTKPAVVTF